MYNQPYQLLIAQFRDAPQLQSRRPIETLQAMEVGARTTSERLTEKFESRKDLRHIFVPFQRERIRTTAIGIIALGSEF